MERLLKKIFVHNWRQKLVALVSAAVIWLFVTTSITTTRTFTNVSVRVVNLEQDKTIRGLMPNGMLDRKITITLTGTKHVLDKIQPGDFEIVLDAHGKNDQWIVQVAKKNLVSLNPEIDLLHSVTDISQTDLVITLSKLLTDKIPVYITTPKGEPPEGYLFLDIWPKKLTHVVSGPEEDVRELQARGIELTFDLGKITAEDLSRIEPNDDGQKDEISFYVPDSWKKVAIPFLHNIKQEINGPEARLVRIDFLQNVLLPLDEPLSISVFYPLSISSAVNPKTHPIKAGGDVEEHNGLMVLSRPLFVDNVSRLFLDIVKNRLALTIVASAKNNNLKEPLPYAIEFVDSNSLEDAYVALFDASEQKQAYLRDRFRTYMRSMKLFTASNTPFELKSYLESDAIRIASIEE